MTDNLPAILAVDDDPVLLQVLMEQLPDSRFRLITEQSPKKGIEIAKSFLPDLILLDINMGEMNGVDMLRELRADEVTKRIPVIMLTGVKNKDAVQNSLRLGIIDYMVKPHDPKRLLTKIEAALRYGFIEKYEKEIESDYIEVAREDKTFIISFPRDMNSEKFLLEVRKVFNPFFLRQLKTRNCVIDLRAYGDMTYDDIKILNKIIEILKEITIHIVAGKHYGAIVAQSDLEKRANLFLSFGDYEVFLAEGV